MRYDSYCTGNKLCKELKWKTLGNTEEEIDNLENVKKLQELKIGEKSFMTDK